MTERMEIPTLKEIADAVKEAVEFTEQYEATP